MIPVWWKFTIVFLSFEYIFSNWRYFSKINYSISFVCYYVEYFKVNHDILFCNVVVDCSIFHVLQYFWFLIFYRKGKFIKRRILKESCVINYKIKRKHLIVALFQLGTNLYTMITHFIILYTGFVLCKTSESDNN